MRVSQKLKRQISYSQESPIHKFLFWVGISVLQLDEVSLYAAGLALLEQNLHTLDNLGLLDKEVSGNRSKLSSRWIVEWKQTLTGQPWTSRLNQIRSISLHWKERINIILIFQTTQDLKKIMRIGWLIGANSPPGFVLVSIDDKLLACLVYWTGSMDCLMSGI